MIFMINELSGNTHRFACYCVEQHTVAELVAFVNGGGDHDMCVQWGITGEQWKEALLSALEVLRHQA